MLIEQILSAGFAFTEAMTQAATATGGQPRAGGYQFIITMVLMIVIFYFLLIRPQNKRAKEHRELIGQLGVGDEVITSSGILGKITDVKDQYLSVQIADNVEIMVQRQYVTVVLPKDTIKSIKK